jgi:cytochrome c peroxidase
MARISTLVLLSLATALLAACGGDDKAGSAPGAAPAPSAGASNPAATTLSLAAQVGKSLFFDKSLSASGKMACASCHDPDHAYGPPNDLAVQLGGPSLATAGLRAVPSLRYKDVTPPYADLLDNPDGISVPGPGGGFTWDGRAPTLAEQAKVPLLSSFEMANASAADVAAKLKAASYLPLFQQAFGADVLTNANAVLDKVGAALQAYQLEDKSFHPYSSKFDLYAGNKIGGELTAAETRGMQVYTDAKRGNCASCHYQGAGLNGSAALFTDFSYEAISVPRNPAIPANAQAAYVDLGLCGPQRTDHPADAPASLPFCGMFKAPTMRNVATRQVFFHNGVIRSLEQAIRFYNTRDTAPELWYPTLGGTPKAKNDADFPTYGLVKTQYVGGTVDKFNDTPPQFRPSIDTQGPLDGRPRGSAPAMSERDMADLLCFLNTLTDDYKPPAQPPASGACVD